MAQQIINNNNNSILNILSATSGKSYADASVNSFEFAMDSANQLYEKQNVSLNKKNDISSLSSSSSVGLANSSKNKNKLNFETTSNNSKQGNYSDSNYVKDNKSLSSGIKNNNKVNNNSSLSDTDEKLNNDFTNDATSSDKSSEINLNENTVETDTENNEQEVVIETNNEQADNTKIDESFDEQEKDTSLLVEDINIDNNILSLDNTSLLSNIQQENSNIDEDVDLDIENILSDSTNTNTIEMFNVLEETSDTSETISTSMVKISDIDINELKDIESNEQSKDLISQELIDELDITIEDISTSDLSGSDNIENNSIMNSAEQAVKYIMEKNEDSEIKVENISSEMVSGDELEKNQDVLDELPEITEDVETSFDNEIEDDTLPEDNKISEGPLLESDDDSKVNAENISLESDNDPQQNYAENHREGLKKNNSSADDITTDSSFDVEITKSDVKFSNTIGDNYSAGNSKISGISSNISTSQLTSQTMTNSNISKEDIISQIHTKLQSLNNTTNTKLTMVLNPESLGKVQIQLANTKDGMTAELLVSSQNVKDILDTNISQLKDTLTAHGVQVNDVSVKISHTENNSQMDYTEQENQNSNKQNSQDQKHNREKNEESFEQMFSFDNENINEDVK